MMMEHNISEVGYPVTAVEFPTEKDWSEVKYLYQYTTLDPFSLKQHEVLASYRLKCLQSINDSVASFTGAFCQQIWDGIFCWPATAGGSTVEISCPSYFRGFNSFETASKICEPNGSWWIHPSYNRTWSNYSLCSKETLREVGNSPLFAMHVPIIKYISQVGYSISLTLLIIACLILGSIRRLRCPRNNLHLQLFASFILRAFVSLLRDLTQAGTVDQALLKEGSFMCKGLTSVWQYCLMANYCWILMEGLYLHNLLFLSIFSDASGILKYGLAGWGLPVLFLVPWIVLRATLEDDLCWTVNENQFIFWVVRGPITASILLNLFFFLNISRVLFLKMFSNETIQNRRYRYRKWFKSTLVLVPLFGVHYALLLSFSFAANNSETLEIVWLYIDQTFSSFQGSFVAFLYCFLNGEVKAEVQKLYNRIVEQDGKNNPQHSMLTQSLTYLSKGRASVQSLHMVAGSSGCENEYVEGEEKWLGADNDNKQVTFSDGNIAEDIHNVAGGIEDTTTVVRDIGDVASWTQDIKDVTNVIRYIDDNASICSSNNDMKGVTTGRMARQQQTTDRTGEKPWPNKRKQKVCFETFPEVLEEDMA